MYWCVQIFIYNFTSIINLTAVLSASLLFVFWLYHLFFIAFFSLCQLSLILTVFQYPILSPLLTNFYAGIFIIWASQVALGVKNPPANAGDIRDMGSFPGWGRSPGVGNGNPLQYSWLENPMDRAAWWAAVHRMVKSQTQLRRFSLHASANLTPLIKK